MKWSDLAQGQATMGIGQRWHRGRETLAAICTKVSSHAIFTWNIEHVPTSECERQKVLLSASALRTLRFLPSMPDAFFASNKNRKRKRSSARDAGPSTSKKVARGAKGKPQNVKAVAKKRSVADEELSEDTQDDDEREGIDELDLRAPDVDPDAYESGEEDEDETPAQKRLRLAKLYLEGVKQGLSLGAYSSASYLSVL